MAEPAKFEVIDIGSSSGEDEDGEEGSLANSDVAESDVKLEDSQSGENILEIKRKLIDNALKNLKENYERLVALEADMNPIQRQQWQAFSDLKPRIGGSSAPGLITLRPSVFTYSNDDTDEPWLSPARRPAATRRAPARRKKARRTYRRPRTYSRKASGSSSKPKNESKSNLLAKCARAAASMKTKISRVKTESRGGGSSFLKVKSER